MTSRLYCLVFMLIPLRKAEQFIMWPLHLTLVPWFTVPEIMPGTEVAARIEIEANNHNSLSASAWRRVKLGPRGNVPATELKHSIRLQELHEAFVGLIEEQEWRILADKFIKSNFRPHVTDKKQSELPTGTNLLINHLYLIEAPETDPRTRRKTVIDVVRLGGGSD